MWPGFVNIAKPKNMKIQGEKSWETIPTKNQYYRVYTKRSVEYNRKFKSRLKYMEIQGYIRDGITQWRKDRLTAQ